MLKSKIYTVVAAVCLLALSATACAGQEPASSPAPTPAPAPVPTPTPTPPAGEEANFKFLMSDDVNAIEDFEHVYITVSQIGVHSSGESGKWNEFTPDISEVDLKPLTGENALEIWSGNLTAGEYNKVFIYVSAITATLTGDLGGKEANIKLPGEKLQISKPFVISEDAVTSFVYDVTVIKAGQGGRYILKPQIAQSGADQKFKEVKGGKPEEQEVEGTETEEEEDEIEGTEAEGEEAEVTLEGTAWELESYGAPDNLKDVLKDTEITINFIGTEGRIEGSAGCNSYGGGYEVDEDKLFIPGPLMSTAMACPEPIMNQEVEYLAILQNAESYTIDDDRLQIGGGDKVLVFEAK